MKKPNAAQTSVARELFAHEAGSAEERAEAAVNVHRKLFARLSSLLGTGGASALFARAVKLAAADHPCLRDVCFPTTSSDDPAAELLGRLRGESPASAAEASVALCATLLALLTMLIGARLTLQLLRSAWPTFAGQLSPLEDTK